MRILVAIIDNKSGEIVGNHITMHRHLATAIRMFADIANDPNTMLNRHTADFDLVQIGTINDDGQIIINTEAGAQLGHITHEMILTGKAFTATKITTDTTNNAQLPLPNLREVK